MSIKLNLAAAAAVAVMTVANGARADDVVQAAQKAGKFTMLLKAVKQAGLEAKMKAPGPYTVFAPTDAAFAALPPDVAKRLMDPRNKAELGKVLSYHVLAGRLTTREIGSMPRAAESLIGAPLVLKTGPGGTMVNDAKIVMADMKVDNGIVQVIDHVLLPPMPIQPKF